jgi:uncharacterized protein with PIN domain
MTESRAYLRFYAELNDHLPEEQRFQPVERRFLVPGTVKDMIESCGVPHSEVELIVVDGRSVDFSFLVRDGDRFAVYPMFESIDVAPALRVRHETLRDPKFVLDVHLGRLAAYLRMLGFDVFYRNCLDDPELVKVSVRERRILLTRDRGLLKHGAITHGYWLRETDSRRQMEEVVDRFDLARCIRPFTRCMACNGELVAVAKEQVRKLVPRRTAEVFEEFRQCPACERVYWQGPHYRRMSRWVEELTGALPPLPSVPGS